MSALVRDVKSELVLSVLYDLTQTIGSELRLEPLLTKTLHRILYHTSFPVGVALLEQQDEPSGARSARITAAVGARALTQRRGERAAFPRGLLQGRIEVLTDPGLLGALGLRSELRYGLRLPVDGAATLLLLSPLPPSDRLPLEQMFPPVLATLSRSIQLCAENERLTASLTAELATRKQAEAEAQRARDTAVAANRAKSAFLANMSHELRTPMNAILGFSHLLQAEATSARQRDRLDKIAAAGQHLLGVLNDVLDLSKIEAGHLELQESPVHIDAVVDHVHGMMAERARAKRLTLSRNVDPEVAALTLRGDGLRLRQILINYVGNALKFTEAGGVSVSTSLAGRGEGDVLLRFEVRDTGRGVSDELRPRLFQPFEQARGANAQELGGTGLGLAISRRLAEMMGGEVGVDSVQGVGSTFWFTARLAVCASPRASAPPALPLQQLRAGARVLLVEDNPLNQEMAAALLESLGLVVEQASDGLQAIERVRGQRYDLVLMDNQMDRMDGLEATREVRKLPNGRTVPIVAWTANTLDDERERCLAAGMDDFLSKPVQAAQLHATLARWIPRDPAEVHGAARAGVTHPPPEGPAAPPAPRGPDEPVLDRAAGLRYTGGSTERYERLLGRFAEVHGGDADALRAALAAGSHGDARGRAHALKGLAATLGLTAVARTAAQLEGLLVDSSGDAEVLALVARLEGQIREAVATIAAMA